MAQRPTRAEVLVEETWNLSDIYPTEAAWEAELAAVQADIASVVQYHGRLAEGAAILLACLNALESLATRVWRLESYARLRFAEDGTNPANQAAVARSGALMARVGAALAFVPSEILALPEGSVEAYLTAEPGLQSHRYRLGELLAMRPHRLTSETEAALAALREVHHAPMTIFERVATADMQFAAATDSQGHEVPLSLSAYMLEIEGSGDTVLRRRAYDAFVQGLRPYQHTLAAAMATEINRNVVLARLRRYPSAEAMLLAEAPTPFFEAPHGITPAAYNNVLDVIQTGLAPHFRRYARLRQRLLGLERMRFCDAKAPLDPEYDPQISFAEAGELICEALAILGPEYGDVLRRALSGRWIDRCDNIGKDGGAFCQPIFGAHGYILTTWSDTMRSAFVLIHELGHLVHFELAGRHQRMVNVEPSPLFVEAPSTINEVLLGQHLMAQSKDARMRCWVISKLLETYHHNFVTHLLEGELQRRLYRQAEAGEPITADSLGQTKGAILGDFWGDAVEIDDGARLTWMRQPHYYMGLYPYTYAAGLSIGTAVAQVIRAEGEPAAARWLTALKVGGTLPPLELTRLVGVDMSTPEPLRRAVAFVGTLVDELESNYRR